MIGYRSKEKEKEIHLQDQFTLGELQSWTHYASNPPC